MARRTLPRAIAQQLLDAAQQQPTVEICGLIGGHQQQPRSVYPIRNSAAEPKTRFLLDPAEQVAAMRQMRQRDESLFAIYHSHPTSEATPSARDLADVAYRGVLYLIIGQTTAGGRELRAYKLPITGPEPVQLILQ